MSGNGDFRLGSWVVRPRLNTVECDGNSRRLEPKVMAVLCCLADHAGEVVGKDQLIKAVWSDTFVSDDVLTRSISELRHVFDDDVRDPQVIQTIPKRGYRLIAEVEVESEAALARRTKFWTYASFLVLCLVLALTLAFVLPRRVRSPSLPDITRLTAGRKIASAVVSPDGRYLAYVENDDKMLSLWLQQIVSATTTRLVPVPSGGFDGLRFSPDGNYLYFVRGDGPQKASLYQLPTLGGMSREVMTDFAYPGRFAISPDGKSVAFLRRRNLVIASLDGSGERVIATRKGSVWFNWHGPAWSSDGRLIAIVEGRDGPAAGDHLVVVPVEGGPERRITSEGWFHIYQPEWLADGSGIIAAAQGSHMQLWEFPYPAGKPRRITQDLLRYEQVSLTADSNSLVTVQVDFASKIWVGPTSNPDRIHPVTGPGHITSNFGLTWTPGGQIIYWTNAGDRYDFIMMDSDGNNSHPLPINIWKWQPDVCPDGHTLVFMGLYKGAYTIMRGDLDGRVPQPLTHGQAQWEPQCSPDGEWVLYRGIDTDILSKVPIQGGQAVQLTDKPCPSAGISPDGKWVACLSVATGKMAIIPFSGGNPVKFFDVPATFDDDCCPMRWTADGKNVVYVNKGVGVSNLWEQPVSGGPPVPLTHFNSENIGYCAFSHDGSQVAIDRGIGTEDAVMITNFR
jgi:DNA-binding winged helix-turn-helix (wHTH) protein/Tol biopolymer transport system component